MMDAAIAPPARCRTSGDIQFRDGLLLAVLSLWPMRRRSIAALTIDRHLEFDSEGINILLHREDTKSKRAESCRLHEQLVPYLTRYLSEVRPRFYGSDRHKGLWASQQGCPLTAGGLYDIVRKHTRRGFNKPMGLHDFRRAMATFLAAEEPRLVGLIPGVLQHADPKVGEQHYNLARSIGASRRHLSVIRQMRDELRLFS
jgi:integrase